MNNHVHIITALLLTLSCAVAFSADNVPSDHDIGKAMNLLPPGVQNSLNDAVATDTRSTGDTAPELSLRCRQLRADVERARHGEPEPQRDTYPQERHRDGGFVPAPSSIPGVQFSSAQGQIRYGQRARLEEQFLRECQ